jgi:hypothetical protein
MAKTTKTINVEMPYTLKAKTVATQKVSITPPYPVTINACSFLTLSPAFIGKNLPLKK